MRDVLHDIVKAKRNEVEQAKARRPLDDVKEAARQAPPPRDFFAAVAAAPVRRVNLIAEIKKKSPSAGLIRADFDPVSLARTYHASAASALSVLTDEPFFAGRLEFISQVKSAVPLPVLRKDFMLEPYQIYESRAAGADAVLLIGEVLEPGRLGDMLALACDLDMTSLIEVHDEETLDRLQNAVGFPNNQRSLLGINNRNLKLQQIDLATTERLAARVGKRTIVVSESGVRTRADVDRLADAGARALLIGETLMRAADIKAAVTELLGPLPE